MKMSWRISLLFILVFCYSRSAESASFYGSGHASLPFQDAQSTTDLSFRFRTSRAEALLVLVAGRTDYCLVMLQAGAVKVHINLGAGESEISSPRGLRLDDLKWHEVKITRTQADLSLTIDRKHSSRISLPGRYYELNVHFGIFVGGMGNFNELFLGNRENFRGCLDSVFFNGRDVLTQSKEKGIIEDLTWDCSEEFDATSEQPISFLSDQSFISFPSWISRTGALVSFKVKTRSEMAVLLYNTGPSSNQDYVALDLWKGRPRLLVDQGNGVIELWSDVPVNDGGWHEVKAQFNPSYLEVTVDGRKKSHRPELRDNRHIDLSGLLYFGGIEATKRSRAVSQGVTAAQAAPVGELGGLRGCLSHLELDGRRIGLPEVLETNSIQAGCQWQYPCQNKPCIAGATCHQDGVKDFKCECDHAKVCTKEGFYSGSSYFGGLGNRPVAEWVDVKVLEVAEGGRALITAQHLKVVVDYGFYGIPQSGVLFHMATAPSAGRLDVNVWDRKDDSIFTLVDLNTDQVFYVHDGSESTQDSIIFDIELTSGSKRGGSASSELPPEMRVKQRFRLQISIRPQNDVPKIELAGALKDGKPLRIAEGTTKLLTEDLLNVIDPDSTKAEIVITLVPASGDTSLPGHIENQRFPGQARNSFTLEDLHQGRVSFVHDESSKVQAVGLRVSDGRETGNAVFVDLETFKLQIFVVNNTGLALPMGTSAVISSVNLTYTTNAPDQSINLRFDIKDPPRYGRLERLRGHGKWASTKRFYSRQLEKGKVRYVHIRSNPSSDSFSFVVTVPSNPSSTTASPANMGSSVVAAYSEDTFKIDIISNVVRAQRQNAINLINVKETVITDTYLMYQTYPQTSADSDILYTVVSPPKSGVLLLSSSGLDLMLSSSSAVKLRPGSIFNQVDLLSGHLKYKLTTLSQHKSLDDMFTFKVSVRSPAEASHGKSIESSEEKFKLHYVPGDTTVDITLERLEVEEGARRTISKKYLNVMAPDIIHFVFNITRTPSHGTIDVLAPSKVDVVRANTTFFTSDEIEQDRVVYNHDDSESRRDTFHFVAMASRVGSRGHDFQYVGVFHIHVVLKNDHTPIQIVDKVFQVVENGQRLLTEEDLCFVDYDIDTRPEDIKYSHHALPNGELVKASNPSEPVFEFTQADLNEHRILFKHIGAAFGRIVLWVSDGQYYASTELKVRASPAFIQVVNNSGLIVQRGDSSFLSRVNLSVTTNLNAFGSDIKYRITKPPTSGIVLKDDVPVLTFTAQDLLDESIEYRHNNSHQPKDEMRLEINAAQEDTGSKNSRLEASTKANFVFHVYPESYWEPLAIASNNSILVEESTSIAITRYDLQVESKAEMSPKDIIYMIKRPPLHGYLEIDPPSALTSNAVSVFDQSIINEGRLHYIQSISNQSSDSFVFDVTNGISGLNDLVFHLTILPKNLYIETRDLVVTEGQSATLTLANIHVITDFFVDKINDYLIVDPPTSGRLVSIGKKEPSEEQAKLLPAVTIFSVEDLEQQRIRYFHNGADTTMDQMTLVASTGTKTSMPATLIIRILPVNDEMPVLVNNTGLEVWAGATTPITNRHLGATDADSDAENITFILLNDASANSLGYLSLQERRVTRFTQKDLEQQRVFFTHHGRRRVGSLSFQLSDGLNKAENGQTYTFNIRVKDLSIHLERHESLDVFPMMQATVRPDNLLVTTSDKGSKRPITFLVKKSPKMGRLLLRTANLEKEYIVDAKNFSQMDVNEGRVLYEHRRPFSNLTAFDVISLEAMADYAQRNLDLVLNIRISVTAMMPGAGNGIDRFIGAEDITLEEGAMTAIRTRNLNTSGILDFIRRHRQQGVAMERFYDHPQHQQPPLLRLQVSALPQHGKLLISKEPAILGQLFTQLDIDRGFVSYVHDHSDTIHDTFGVAIFLEGDKSETFGDGRGQSGDVLLYEGTWNVTIRAINDRPFRLLTENPGMTVVQRQSKAIVASLLFTEDPDTPAEHIIYDVMKAPAFGQLVLADNISQPLMRFTQWDINHERVVYFHDDGGPSTDFYFRVSDGKFNPVYRHFRIHIIPLEIKVVNNSAIQIQQGLKMAHMTSSNIGVKTNGQRALTFYNITKGPSGGLIYMNDAPASVFGQINVDNEEVVYMQSDMNLSNDSFTATISNQDAVLREVQFDIEVVPLVRKMEAFKVTEGKMQLNQRHLDASHLAGLTNSNPVYFMTETPDFGKIMRIVRASSNSNEANVKVRDREVWQFTHEDVKNGVIYFVLGKNGGNKKPPFNDSFTYKLEAPGVQPAFGTFEFVITTTKDELSKTISNPITEDVTGGGMSGSSAASGKSGQDDGVPSEIVISISAIFVLLLILIVVVFVIRYKRSRDAARSKCTAPNNTKLNGDTTMTSSAAAAAGNGNPYGTIQRCASSSGMMRRPINNGFATLEQHPHNTLRSMNGSLPRPDLHLPLSETDSWSCSRSRDTSPESSIPPGMPSFRVIPLTCESDAGSLDPCANGNGAPAAMAGIHESPYVMRASEPPDWETEPLQRSGSVQPPSTLLRKNQYWV